MRFYNRPQINSLLRLAYRQSFRVVYADENIYTMIPQSVVLDVLNRAASNEPPVSDIPADLWTPEELAAESGFAAARIKSATKRDRNPLPCFRLNQGCIRIRKSSWDAWLGNGRRNLGRKREAAK